MNICFITVDLLIACLCFKTSIACIGSSSTGVVYTGTVHGFLCLFIILVARSNIRD